MKLKGSMISFQKARHPEDSGPSTNHTADRCAQYFKPKMYRIIPIFLFLIFATIIKGQDLIISFAPTYNNVFYYQGVKGGVSGNSKFGCNVSLEFIKSEANKISYGFGLSYQYSNVEIVPAPLPPIETVTHTESLNLIIVNFKTVFNFRKECFLSLDPFLDLQLKSESQQTIDDQTGIGLSAGFGKRFPLKNGMFINLEPRLWVHNIVPFVDNLRPLRLTILGLKAGINFRGK